MHPKTSSTQHNSEEAKHTSELFPPLSHVLHRKNSFMEKGFTKRDRTKRFVALMNGTICSSEAARAATEEMTIVKAVTSTSIGRLPVGARKLKLKDRS